MRRTRQHNGNESESAEPKLITHRCSRSLQLSSVISINTTHPLKVLVYTEVCGHPDNRPVFWFRFPIKSCHFKSVSGRKFFAVIRLFLPAPPWFNSRSYKRAAETFTQRLISERQCEDTGCNPSVNGLGGGPLRGCCRRSIYPWLVYSGGQWKTHSKTNTGVSAAAAERDNLFPQQLNSNNMYYVRQRCAEFTLAGIQQDV